jgi:hypothetical protein
MSDIKHREKEEVEEGMITKTEATVAFNKVKKCQEFETKSEINK